MRRAAVLLGLLASLSACGPEHLILRSEPQFGSEPSGLATKPKVFLDRFEDASGGITVFGRRAGAVTEPPLAEALRQAVGAQLQGAGLTLAGARAQADEALSVVVNAAEIVNADSLSALVLQRAAITLTAALADAAGNPLGKEMLHAAGELRRFGRESTTHNMIMNAALDDAVAKLRDFCMRSKAVRAAPPAAAEAKVEPVVSAPEPAAVPQALTDEQRQVMDAQLLP